jgi:type II secretory pathway pseudopilin PulG
MSSNKSFTLIELLIVIGILAVLVAAIVVTLNPAQLLAQARDSKRQQDLSALNQALNTIYALDQTTSFGTSSTVYTSLPDSTTTCANWNLPSLPSGWQYYCSPTTTLQNTDGTGWIPVNFKTTGVVSLSSLPIDPQNTSSTGLYYTYVSGGSFQLASHFESAKYQATEGSDAMYTVGSNLNLAPFLSGLVGWWKFDEASGTTTADSSGYNNTGIMYSSTTPTYILTSTGCKSGNCASFDGVNSYHYVSQSSVSINSPITINVWINYAVAPSGSWVPIVEQGGTRAFRFVEVQGKFCFGNDTTVNNLYCTTNIFSASNTWYYITASAIDQNNLHIYVNGIEYPLIYQPGAYGPWGTNQLNIGYRSYAPSVIPFNGLIDDVRIYNRALSASEIQALYNATK